MNDVLERLRAANPVSDCAQPDLNSLLCVLDGTVSASANIDDRTRGMAPRGAPRRQRLLRQALAIALAGVLLAGLAVATRTGRDISLVARAYAATDPAGGVVHYTWTSRFIIPLQGGAGALRERDASYVEERAQVWRSASRSRTVTVSALHFRDGRVRAEGASEVTTEHIANEVRTSWYSTKSKTIIRSASAGHISISGPCWSLIGCYFGQEDPVSLLHRIYATGRVREAGTTHLHGQALSVLTYAPTPDARRRWGKALGAVSQLIVIDPKTGDPLEVSTQYGTSTAMVGYSDTIVFHEYKLLQRTSQSERLLAMRAHPRAQVICAAAHCPS
jgi:hypothetical protein